MNTDQHQQELGLRETGAVKRVEEYKFEPIRGYPMFQWAGKHPFTSTQYYPAQLKETYGPEVNGWRNKIYWGDNLQVMSHLLKAYRGQVKLVYIDPPFDSKADYKRTINVRGKEAQNDQSVFEEKQYSDIWTNDEYLQFMYERIILMKELLSDTGSIYLHCDFHKEHHLRCILDEVFGSNCFINDIVWKRSTNTSSIGQIWKRAHDNILFYSKSDKYDFNFQYKALSEASVELYQNEDEKGQYQLVPVLVSGKRSGSTGQPWKNIDPNKRGKAGMHWITRPEKLDQYLADGLIVFPDKEGGIPRLKYYLMDNKGVVFSDLWDDINLISSAGIESLNYPTQKPEALLERIIKTSSNEGDLVFDCFMGSGTTQAVAMRLGRRFIGADINLGAVQLTTKRLIKDAEEITNESRKLILEEERPTTFYISFDVYNVNNYDIFRNPVQAKELLIQALEVNPLPAGSLFDGEKDGRMVKIMPINRIATRQDLNELITGFDYRAFEKRQTEHPNQAVEKVTLVCMGHEPDLAAHLQHQMSPFKLDTEVVDILRDKQDLQFKRDSEAKIAIRDGYLVIEQFYPMNLLAKLSLQQDHVEDWRELVDSIIVDWNYDGAVLQPAAIDVPEGNELVAGRYHVPDDAGTIRVKITDLLSESLEMELTYG